MALLYLDYSQHKGILICDQGTSAPVKHQEGEPKVLQHPVPHTAPFAWILLLGRTQAALQTEEVPGTHYTLCRQNIHGHFLLTVVESPCLSLPLSLLPLPCYADLH